jgi:hypothetical protein
VREPSLYKCGLFHAQTCGVAAQAAIYPVTLFEDCSPPLAGPSSMGLNPNPLGQYLFQ